MLEPNSRNISETRTGKDRRKVTMEGLLELTNALSEGTIPDPLELRNYNPQPKLQSKIAGKRVHI